MTRMPPVLVMLALALVAGPGFAQPTFDEVTPSANPYFDTPPEQDFWVNATAPADVDGDGDLDLAVIGFHVVYDKSVEDRLVILRNDGAGTGGQWTFTALPVPLGSVVAGASDLAWGDFDNDGDDDLALGSEGATVIYRNDDGTLTPMPNVLPGYYEDSAFTIAYDLRSLSFADADNDGDLDLLVPSVYDEKTFEFRTVLLRNDGSDGQGGWQFVEDAQAGIDPSANAQSAWADADDDGDLDLMLLNIDSNGESGFLRRYLNTGGSFSGSALLDLRVEHGMADWGDADGDGDLDVLVAGNIREADDSFTTVLRTYENAGGTLTPHTLAQSPGADWLDFTAATWADYDSDGDMDILLTGSFIGESKIVGKSDIYANNAGTFTALGLDLPAPVDSIGRGGTFTWFDIDGDGDLDYLVAGAYYVEGGNGLVEAQMHLYRNQTAAANAAPAAPASAGATASGDGVLLSWLAPADDHTPAAQLTYDLEITAAAAAIPLSRRLPEPGSIGSSTAWAIAGLADGAYRWQVRAVDTSFNGGPSAGGVFIIGSDSIFASGFEPSQ
ncbi:MAG: VCBS repeat-containing protein [Xanthomonadales bacterium]|nr:VCBS repeat-containing protein [Xanthomonadales bacterium]